MHSFHTRVPCSRVVWFFFLDLLGLVCKQQNEVREVGVGSVVHHSAGLGVGVLFLNATQCTNTLCKAGSLHIGEKFWIAHFIVMLIFPLPKKRSIYREKPSKCDHPSEGLQSVLPLHSATYVHQALGNVEQHFFWHLPKFTFHLRRNTNQTSVRDGAVIFHGNARFTISRFGDQWDVMFPKRKRRKKNEENPTIVLWRQLSWLQRKILLGCCPKKSSKIILLLLLWRKGICFLGMHTFGMHTISMVRTLLRPQS